MPETIVVINAGSSSIKFSLFEIAGDDDLALLQKGQLEGMGVRPRLIAVDAKGATLVETRYAPDEAAGHEQALGKIGEWLLTQIEGPRLAAVGHRVVHGGPDFAAPVAVDERVLKELEKFVPLAPLHQPNNLAAIHAVRKRFPDMTQVACFDTAFHRGHSELADRYALPDALYRQGIRRYGFHGLSYEYISRTLPRVAPELAKGKVVAAHLGSGASMCAIKAGRSVDSTMGFTALDGLPMGTRCGAIDPGIPLYLMAEKGYDLKSLERLLYFDSGLKGISGISNDMRELEASKDPKARLALDYFVYRIGQELGRLSASLRGIDALVFTAGIGENAANLRVRVCQDAAWLGLSLDEEANDAGGPRITKPGSRVSAWVIPTDEEKMIALHTLAVIRGRYSADAA